MREIVVSKQQSHLVRSRALKFRLPLDVAAADLASQTIEESCLDFVKVPTVHTGIVSVICVIERINYVFLRKQLMMLLFHRSHRRLDWFLQNPIALNLKH